MFILFCHFFPELIMSEKALVRLFLIMKNSLFCSSPLLSTTCSALSTVIIIFF